MTLDDLVAKFKGASRSSEHAFKALCPAHDDHTPSLSIFETDGRLAVKCHTGCSTSDVLSKIGLTSLNRRVPKDAPPVGDPVATYDYEDEHGVLRARKLRYVPKTFRWERPDGRGGFRSGDGGYKGPYNLPAVIAAPLATPLFVVEGEKAVNALRERGQLATCGPAGAGSPFLNKYRNVFKGRHVVVLGDQDDAGEQFAKRWAQEIASSGAASVRLLTYLPMVAAGGDVVDYLQQASDAEKAIATILERAEVFTPHASSPAEFPNTESGDAEFFAQMYSEDLRYDHRRGRWLQSDAVSGLWLPDQTESTVPLATAAMRERQRCALNLTDHDRKTDATKWALKGENRNRLNNLLALAQSVRPLSDSGEHWDEDPWLLGTPTGAIDLRTGEHRKALPGERITMRVRVGYDPDADCPLWKQTLGGIFASNDLFDQEEGQRLVDFMQRALGYSITGDCREECCFFPWGEGQNGKGTLMNTIGWLLQDYTDDMPYSTLEKSIHGGGIPNDIAKIDGKRFITCSEVNEFTLNEARLKALTGRDPMTARFLNKEFFTFIPVGKIWISTNNKPKIVGQDLGIWRRIHLVPFVHTFSGASVNTKLKDQLRQELPGILNWLVAGARLWQERGLDPPQTVRAATAAYREESNPITPFLEERCVVAEHCSVQAGLAWQAYLRFCDDRNVSGIWRMSNKAFFKAMEQRFQKVEQRNASRGHVQAYAGVGLRDDAHRGPDAIGQ